MQKMLMIALRYTIATTLLLGIGYPLFVTFVAQHIWKNKANGQLVVENGIVVGSRLIGQSFTGDEYFHSRPSAAGSGYDATASGASNYGPTNQKLLDRVAAGTQAEQSIDTSGSVPIDLVTASASGLDPDITPAAAEYQAKRIAQARGVAVSQVEGLIAEHTTERQFGLLGERRVNVLELNMALSQLQRRR